MAKGDDRNGLLIFLENIFKIGGKHMKKKIIAIMVCVCLFIGTGLTTAFAKYGKLVEISVSSGTGYRTHKTLCGTKTTYNDNWFLYVEKKTMWTYPYAKLVDADGNDKGTEVTIKNNDVTYSGISFRTEKNKNYYVAVKPRGAQFGTDKITAKVDPG